MSTRSPQTMVGDNRWHGSLSPLVMFARSESHLNGYSRHWKVFGLQLLIGFFFAFRVDDARKCQLKPNFTGTGLNGCKIWELRWLALWDLCQIKRTYCTIWLCMTIGVRKAILVLCIKPHRPLSNWESKLTGLRITHWLFQNLSPSSSIGYGWSIANGNVKFILVVFSEHFENF